MTPEQQSALAALAAAEEAVDAARLRVFLARGPTHVDRIRDPNAPCESFRLGAPEPHATCQTDGHYVCDDCVSRASCARGCGKRPSQCECAEEALR